jgi:hypothetical protein
MLLVDISGKWRGHCLSLADVPLQALSLTFVHDEQEIPTPPNKLLNKRVKHVTHPPPAFLSILFITQMIQVHIELLFNELEDIRLENIIEHTVDIDRTMSLEGIPCIGAARNRLKTCSALKLNVSVFFGVYMYGPSWAVMPPGARLAR